jgi:hypothetical protein
MAYSRKFLKVLKYPTDKQVWVEGTKSDGTTKYFYNPLTSKAAPKPPDGSNIAIMQQMDLAEKLDQYQPATLEFTRLIKKW